MSGADVGYTLSVAVAWLAATGALVCAIEVLSGWFATRLPVRLAMSRKRADGIVDEWVAMARAGMEPTQAWGSCQHEIGCVLHGFFGPTNTLRAIERIFAAHFHALADEYESEGLLEAARSARRRAGMPDEREAA